MTRLRPNLARPVEETFLAPLPLVQDLTGFTPYELRSLIIDCLATDEPPPVRSVFVNGRRLVHLDDALKAAAEQRCPR